MIALFLLMIEDAEDQIKFNNLYSTYHDKLFSVAMAVTKDFYDAEDALQNAFYVIAKNIKRIKTEDEKLLRSFLYTVVRNSSINLCKARKRNSFDSLDMLFEYESEENFVKNIEENEQYVKLVKHIYSLPDELKDILVMNLLNGLSCSEISKILSINRNTVKSRVSKAKKLLQNEINEAKKNEKS